MLTNNYSHFYETQTRPEFLFHLIVCYYKRGSTKKALHLTEQFLLKGDNGSGADRLYRQSKIPSLTLMRLKILVNFNRDLQKGLETANYLLTLYPGLENNTTEGIEERYILDECVADYL